MGDRRTNEFLWNVLLEIAFDTKKVNGAESQNTDQKMASFIIGLAYQG